jgi:predicted acylesterase/phospholipase RssA
MKTQNGKTALVLAGGGLTGAVYEIGALRAIDDLLVDRTVNDFDIFVGTSAGSLVAAFIANGISPEAMLQVIDGSHPDTAALSRDDIFHFNYADILRWGGQLPGRLVGTTWQYLREFGSMTFFDILWSMAAAIPAGLYDSLALDQFVRRTLKALGRSNDFRRTHRELYIIATELDSGERVVFGKDDDCDTPISLAVAASSALPLVYRPVRIGAKEYIDGGLRGTASLDLAIERGATLVVCINPLVPFDNRMPLAGPRAGGKLAPRALSSKGIQSVAGQAIRIFSHAGLQYHIKQLRRTHPEVDIILIEPRPEDYEMFFYNIMRYSARVMVARHGFESVTLDLAVDYADYKQIMARHGIPISRRLVIEELAEIMASNYDPATISRILEARRSDCGQSRFDTPVCELTRVLAELDQTLQELEEIRYPVAPPQAESSAAKRG